MKKKANKVVLAYSGGLDTSVMLHWLKKSYDCEVVAFIADVGQIEDWDRIQKRALATGASSFHRAEICDEFVEDYVSWALKGAAVYEGHYLLGTSLARPVIAKHQIELAQQLGADAVAHGATGKGNDQIRFELTFKAINPKIQVIAPWRTWEFKSRSDLLRYAEQNEIPIETTAEKPYSIDENLIHTSYEGGVLEDPWHQPEERMFLRTTALEQTPNEPTIIRIQFHKGLPMALDDKEMTFKDIIVKLNHLAGEHGIGRVDIVENRFIGMKSRGVYETPALTVLHKAHRAVESLTLDREAMFLRDSQSQKFAQLIYNGFWFAPEFKALCALIESTQQRVTGEVRLKLFKGQTIVLGRRSENSLYSSELATFEEDGIYNQYDAEGFIKLNALRLQLS